MASPLSRGRCSSPAVALSLKPKLAPSRDRVMVGRSPSLAYGLPIVAAVALLSAIASIASINHSRPRVEPRLAPPTPLLIKVADKRAAPVPLIGAVDLVELVRISTCETELAG